MSCESKLNLDLVKNLNQLTKLFDKIIVKHPTSSLVCLLFSSCFQVAMLGNTELVRALLAAGADPNARDHILNLTVTHDAAREGFAETVRELVNHGADVNLADEIGNLPLHLAAREGHLEVVRVLLDLTEDPRRTNQRGHTALWLARDFNRAETADFIEQYLDPE